MCWLAIVDKQLYDVICQTSTEESKICTGIQRARRGEQRMGVNCLIVGLKCDVSPKEHNQSGVLLSCSCRWSRICHVTHGQCDTRPIRFLPSLRYSGHTLALIALTDGQAELTRVPPRRSSIQALTRARRRKNLVDRHQCTIPLRQAVPIVCCSRWLESTVYTIVVSDCTVWVTNEAMCFSSNVLSKFSRSLPTTKSHSTSVGVIYIRTNFGQNQRAPLRLMGIIILCRTVRPAPLTGQPRILNTWRQRCLQTGPVGGKTSVKRRGPEFGKQPLPWLNAVI